MYNIVWRYSTILLDLVVLMTKVLEKHLKSAQVIQKDFLFEFHSREKFLSVRNQIAEIFNCSSFKIIFLLHLRVSVQVNFYNWFLCEILFSIRIRSLALIESEMTASNIQTILLYFYENIVIQLQVKVS